MSESHLEVSSDAGIVTIRLNRPQTRNAMTPDMGEEMIRVVDRIRADRDVRAVVITGAGKAFCSGGDLSMIAHDTGARDGGPSIGASPRDFYDRFLSIRRIPVPTIAAINGHAIGAGMCFALACDLRVAAAGVKMGMTFARLGIHPGMGATHLLPRLIGAARACELFFTGRVIDAIEAERLGIVNRVVPAEELSTAVSELAAEIAACGPVAVRLMKKSIYRGLEDSLDAALDLESAQQTLTFATADAREGISAMLEKRPPKFEGC